MSWHIQFSIGPVQSFVAQARRTRDLWAGSYLLSFLTAHAMAGARRAGANVVAPRVEDDPLLAWVENRGQGKPPRFGSLPNQFTVEVPEGQEPRRVAEEARKEFYEAWQKVCKAVWEYLRKRVHSLNGQAEQIWRRQIDGFWEFLWVAGQRNESGLLARRKLWRTHWPPDEPGDKCVLMPDFQELSGYVRAIDREGQNAFWEQVRSSLPVAELDEEDRLCAIALVKRLFPLVSQEALGWDVGVRHWPSTADVAALPWVEKVLEQASELANEYAAEVKSAAQDNPQTGGASRLLLRGKGSEHEFAKIDAYWFHQAYLANPKLIKLKDESRRRSLQEQLAKIVDRVGESPSIYFAVLLADGDRLGEVIRRYGGEKVSAALAYFTSKVSEIVENFNGATVYAGGDDLLALLPLAKALECAKRLRNAYDEAFRYTRCDFQELGLPTLSAAVVLAHARSPLKLILAEAHRLLDEVAKEENGRDSLAVGIFREHTPAAQWVSTWQRTGADNQLYCAVDTVEKLASQIKTGEFKAFIYSLAETLGRLCGLPNNRIGRFAKLPNGFRLEEFVRGQLERAAIHRMPGSVSESVEALASLIDRILRRSRQDELNRRSSFIGLDGLTVASFIATGGLEGEHWR